MARRIRDHDWAATPLGRIDQWPQSLRTAVDLMAASAQPVYVGWGDALISFYNDSYVAILGDRHPRSLGLPYRDMWPEIWDASRPVAEAVMAGEARYFTDAPILLAGRGDRPNWFTASWTPIRRENGTVGGVYCVVSDNTDRVRAEQARETRFRSLFESIEEGVCICERTPGERVDFRYLAVNPAFLRQGGFADPVGKTMRDLDPGIDQAILARYAAVADTAEPQTFVSHVAGLDRDFEIRATPDDRPGRIMVLFRDTTARTRDEAAFSASEERFQQFAKASSGALWIRDASTLAMEYASPAIATIYGVGTEALLGDKRSWADLILAEDRDDALKHLEQARRGRAVTHEFRIRRASDGALRWIRDTDFPLRDSEGQIQRIGGIAEDITETKAAARRQNLLLAELQHRVRNILAMVHSIVNRSAETAPTLQALHQHLDGRISALARTQVLLTRRTGAGIDLSNLVFEELLAQTADEERVSVDGPPIMLAPKAAEVLTLAIHELATNATKYGALASATGALRIAWDVEEADGKLWLRLDWDESGVTLKSPTPSRSGFGMELIRKRVPYDLGGRGEIEFRPQGVHCRIVFPLVVGESILDTREPGFGGADGRH